VAWSAGAERITGFPAEEVLGRPCNLLSGPECKGFEGAAALLADPRGREGLRDQECRVQRRDGRPAHLLGNLRLLRDDQGRVAGAVGTFTDLTRLGARPRRGRGE
jgi:two-component system, NtrC family, response regulator HydG